MRIKTNTVNSILLFQIVFFTFLGFYAVLLIAIHAGMSGFTRQITIPVRLLIVVSLVGLVFFNFKKIKAYDHVKIFLVFSCIFIIRIIADYYNGTQYYLSTVEVLFYFFSFCIIPFLSISTFRLKEGYFTVIINSLLVSGFLFSILSLLFYRDFIGQVGRLSSSSVGEEVISPLALSYSATLLIGVIIFYFIFNKTSKFLKIIGCITLLSSIAPLFLGASRGALIALFVPFVFLLLARLNLKTLALGTILLSFLVFGLIYLSESLGSGLIQRFTNISSDIDQGSGSAIRLVMWENSFLQFQFNPVFGDQLGVNGFNGYYPHNFILEILQSTGILGFIPFFFLLYSAISICVTLFKGHPKYSWIAVIFIQAFIRSMFSGAVYNAAWFWTSMALVLSFGEFIKKRKLSNDK